MGLQVCCGWGGWITAILKGYNCLELGGAILLAACALLIVVCLVSWVINAEDE